MALLLIKYHGAFLQTDTCQILLPRGFMMLESLNNLQLLAELQQNRIHKAQVAVAMCI